MIHDVTDISRPVDLLLRLLDVSSFAKVTFVQLPKDISPEQFRNY